MGVWKAAGGNMTVVAQARGDGVQGWCAGMVCRVEWLRVEACTEGPGSTAPDDALFKCQSQHSLTVHLRLPRCACPRMHMNHLPAHVPAHLLACLNH